MASEGLSERGWAWQDRIEHQQSIGLSITKYCDVVGVSTASFYQRRKRLAVGETSISQGVGPPPTSRELATMSNRCSCRWRCGSATTCLRSASFCPTRPSSSFAATWIRND